METNIKAASLAYARAVEAVQKAEAPLRQFEQRLETWKHQRAFLHRRLNQAQIALADAEDQLLALAKA